MKTYTLKEVSKKINVAPGILRQWEKEFEDLLEIPRSKQGARIYTDVEIDFLLEIKQMASKKLSKVLIREQLLKGPEAEIDTITAEVPLSEKQVEQIQEHEPENETIISEVPIEVIADSLTPVAVHDDVFNNTELFFEAMETYKKNFLNEVKEEIRNVVRKEVVEEVKKEIYKGTYHTVKSISDSIYKSSATTKADIQELSESLERTSENTSQSLQYLSKSIANVSIDTTEEIFTLSKQLSETTEELAHYVDVTNTEISSLTDAITKDREFFIEEHNQYRHEVTQRELAFQQMLTGFRDVAAAKEKKWWKFWAN
ncbi:DNA-binding transcriptional MerR regulator [Bacillus sp. SLBN-46]|uniref:MerR family transcriptional regulator n=1 Tax=Bacillus sp. SLBN-46 TaxID=3042283 RepID=UPI00285C835D|nr:MerR family transcriptional regulator [Bacillus sp. SLBN-46]MDR6122870.1 DNA-binding transcriptional MerR regulator [Bacillus sp. SLBN-46]